MKKISRRRFTADELVTIYTHMENGTKKARELARETRTSSISIYSAYAIMKKYLLNFRSINRKMETYCAARKMILRKDAETIVPAKIEEKSEQPPKEDGLGGLSVDIEVRTKLENTLNSLPQLIEDFIVNEVNTRTHFIEAENRQLKAALEGAKIGNIVLNINRRLNGQI